MEKGAPACKLSVVKAMVAAGQVRSTMSALAGAAALGFDFDGHAGDRPGAEPFGFSQEHDNPRRSPGLAGRVPTQDAGRRGVLKLTVIDEVLIVSFKEP